MKVTLKKVFSYKVACGGKDLGSFWVDSEWQGMTKLVNNEGQSVIVDTPPLFFDGIFGRSEGTDVDVVKASPHLLPNPQEAGVGSGGGSK